MMAHAEDPLSREDQFVRSNNRRSLAYAGAFGVWQLADLMKDHATGAARIALLGVTLSAWATWGVLMVITLRSLRALKTDPVLRAAMQDERAKEIQLRAYRAAFWVTVGTAGLLGILAADHAIAADTVTRLVVVIGVTSFIVTRVILDRE